MKILYVEDNPANLFLVKRIATIGGHTVLSYIDGEEALRNFANDDPDLVLMDVQLAGDLTGLDVVRKLRERGYNTPIIAVTAYAMIGDRNRCLEAGCDDYIAKPLPVGRLVELFQHYTDITKLETVEVTSSQDQDKTPTQPTRPDIKITKSGSDKGASNAVEVEHLENENEETEVMPQSAVKTHPENSEAERKNDTNGVA